MRRLLGPHKAELVGDARGSGKASRSGNVFSAKITPAISQRYSNTAVQTRCFFTPKRTFSCVSNTAQCF